MTVADLDGTVPPGDFARDTEVWPDEEVPGRFHADLPEAWRVFYAFGGCTMAVALRAAHRALGRDDVVPVSATATFAAPVPCGPLVIDTEVLRSGRSAAQVTSSLRSGSSEGTDVRLTAVFGRLDPGAGASFVEAEYPVDALDVDECVAPPPQPEGSPFANINYHHQTEFRPAMKGRNLFAGDEWEPGPARSLSWHRLLVEPRRADGTIDPVAYCAPADILGPALMARTGPVGPDHPPFLVLSLEISVQFLATTASPWVLQHCHVPHAGEGYAYSYTELWDPDRRLLALATQRCNVRVVSLDRFAQPDGTA